MKEDEPKELHDIQAKIEELKKELAALGEGN